MENSSNENTKHTKFSGNRQFFFSQDDDFKLPRQSSFDFAKVIADYVTKHDNLKVLEIGPSGSFDPNTSYDEFDTSSLIRQSCKSSQYLTCDLVDTRCDYTCSVENLSSLGVKFDVIVMLSVLEHVRDVFSVPEELHKSLNDGGVVFISTPFLFKVHGPVPDYWRLTQYSYDVLFGSLFDLDVTTYPPNQLGKNSFPLCFNVVAEKK
jgi:hypothetical protein